jgi:hypothetical protein
MIGAVTVLMFVSMAAVAAPAGEPANLCYNGDFSNTNNPLAGWNVDYDWMQNKNYMGQLKKVSILPEYKGKKNVLYMTTTHQTKVESKLIPIEKGVRYKCTVDVCNVGGIGLRCYFNCYKWAPGIEPNSEPKLSELRRIYKGEPWTGSTAQWKTITFYLPLAELSELAYEHYREVRFATVYLLSDECFGGAWFANVKVTKIPETYKVVKSDIKNKTAVKAKFKEKDDD